MFASQDMDAILQRLSSVLTQNGVVVVFQQDGVSIGVLMIRFQTYYHQLTAEDFSLYGGAFGASSSSFDNIKVASRF